MTPLRDPTQQSFGGWGGVTFETIPDHPCVVVICRSLGLVSGLNVDILKPVRVQQPSTNSLFEGAGIFCLGALGAPGRVCTHDRRLSEQWRSECRFLNAHIEHEHERPQDTYLLQVSRKAWDVFLWKGNFSTRTMITTNLT